jgi:hypothetical protein
MTAKALQTHAVRDVLPANSTDVSPTMFALPAMAFLSAEFYVSARLRRSYGGGVAHASQR